LKTLLLMRHAKSSWNDPDLSDHDRPLNKRGKQDAPRMGRWLAEHGLTPDVIVTSTARRARKTAKLVAEACGYDAQLVESPGLYQASPDHWTNIVQTLPETAARVLCVGHNPGLEELLTQWFAKEVPMPTGAIAVLTLDVDAWRDAGPRTTRTLRAVQRVKELEVE
jgi:phosphohistidine phosphatase